MKMIRAKISASKYSAMEKMAPLQVDVLRKEFEVHPNYDINKYEGSTPKDYYLRNHIDLSKDYKYIVSVELVDFGFPFDNELVQEKGRDGEGRLKLNINSVDRRVRHAEIDGSIFGSSYDFGSTDDAIVELQVSGISASQELKLFEELLLEAYSLELEGNLRVSFFSYFTALEALVTSLLDQVQQLIPSELHHALEHLQLDEKLRVIAKHYLDTPDLETVALWGEFAGLFKVLKKMRNEIAHGQGLAKTTQDEVDGIFLIICVLFCLAHNGHADYTAIRKFLYPSQRALKEAAHLASK